MQEESLPRIYDLALPEAQRAPLVFASPHSGADYPQDFLRQSILDPHLIRSSEDAFVDRLFGSAPELGAPLLSARLPRAYIDLNRAPDELDPAVVEGVGRSTLNPRIASGLGVIPRVVAGGRPIYSGKLPRHEVDRRIREVWHPYHDKLRELMDQTWLRFGEVLLIDCHSMPHEAIHSATPRGKPLPEIVLGDRFGASAAPWVTEIVEEAFRTSGLRVARNAPFAGVYVAQAYGRPLRSRHVIQVEIDRSLYMNEARIEPRPDFDEFRQLITNTIVRILRSFRREAPLAAE